MYQPEPMDSQRTKYHLLQMKEKLQAQLAHYKQEISKLQRELEALAVLEQSKVLATEIKDTPQPGLFRKATLKNRMLAAVDTFPNKFTRVELFDAIKKDGKGKVNVGSLSVFFPMLVREGYIALLEKPRGHQQGYYTKGGQAA